MPWRRRSERSNPVCNRPFPIVDIRKPQEEDAKAGFGRLAQVPSDEATVPGHFPSTALRFLLNGEPVAVSGHSPQTTLLEFLRDERRLTGTKEGCAEGDCGACTVILAQPDPAGDALAWQPVNACIRLLP